MKIQETAKEIYDVNLKNGFWKEGRAIGDQDRNFGEALMLVVSELGECVDAHRAGKRAQVESFTSAMCKTREVLREKSKLFSMPELVLELGENYKMAYKDYIKDSVEAELAGTFIRLMDICHGFGIPIEKFIRWELDYNKLREFKHGGAY